MSTTIQVIRICQHCGNEFVAKTTVTRYCGDRCSKQAYKARGRSLKVQQSNEETEKIKAQPLEAIKAKEFLTVKDAAKLFGCSVRTIYHYIENGSIPAGNLGQRLTRIKRSDIERVFEEVKTAEIQKVPEKVPADISKTPIDECYSIGAIMSKFNIAEKTLYTLLKRNNVPKFRKGKYTYIPKALIDQLLKPIITNGN